MAQIVAYSTPGPSSLLVGTQEVGQVCLDPVAGIIQLEGEGSVGRDSR